MAVIWTQALESSYLEKKNKIANSALLTALWVASVLYVFFLGLDYIIHPEIVPIFIPIRFSMAAFFLAVRWLLVRRQKPLSSPYWVTLLLFAIGALSLTSLCVVLGGYTSNYYLAFVVVLILANIFPWTLRQMSLKVTAIVLIYFAVMLAHAGFTIKKSEEFFVNIFVLTAVAFISALFAGINESLRKQNFEQIFEIQQARDEISKLLQIRTRFFANVSHELRTPLALILGPARRLLLSETMSDSSRVELKTIERNVQVLLRHVNDLLDAAKGENGGLSANYQRVDLCVLIRTCASRFEHLAKERGDRLELALPDSLVGEVDPIQFDRLLTNFLSNALKFSPRGGTIRISARPEVFEENQTRSSVLVLRISDSGPGVPQHLRAQIFERFFQVEESSNRKHGGTGLGLAIAKDCIELHHGKVSVGESAEGGAEFTVVLPLRAPAGADVKEAGSEPISYRSSSWSLESLELDQESFDGAIEPVRDESGQNLGIASSADSGTVLVVEDNVELRSFLLRVLGPRWRVETASDGREGLQKALICKPDVILTDLMMPEVSGEELLRAIRGRSELGEIPVIVLTAKADDQLRSELLLKGAQDFQLKPFSPEELVARIHTWMEVKRSREFLQKELKSQQGSLVQLTQEIAEKSARLQNALALAEASSARANQARELRDQFIAVASHELRTPITALKLQLQLAQIRNPETAMKEPLKAMDKQVNHLTRLINEMFDLSNIDKGRLTLKKSVSGVMSLLRSVVEKNEHYLKGLAELINLSSEEDPVMEWDPVRMEQVFTNLLVNAMKYGSGKPIRFLVEADDQKVVVHFEDQGIGIAPKDQERIFERFERGVPYEKISGLGLGLYISREIVRAHGGEMSVKSNLGEGSVFSVRMPRLVSRPQLKTVALEMEAR